MKANQITELRTLSPAERRAVRAERIRIEEAEPYGWIAYSEASPGQVYHLFCDPDTRRLVCTCADFIFRSDLEFNYECKHIAAALKRIARDYLATAYEPHKQRSAPRAA